MPFTMAYQPVVRYSSGTIAAHEALIRGVNGEGARSVLDLVSPATRYAFDQACRVKAISLAAKLGLDTRLNINFMPNAIYDPAACIRLTLATARKHGVPLDALTFEITEDERVFDNEFMRRVISEYRRHGFRIALDDFGSGYAGLNTLLELAPDVVKFDRMLVRAIDKDPQKRILTTGMVQVCRDMGLEITAEGVETQGELEVLLDAGVDLFQGFYFAKPAFERLVTVDEIAPLAGRAAPTPPRVTPLPAASAAA
nr:EAL domain-containing protein [Elioraea rosea]